jgi:hypothetical protein
MFDIGEYSTFLVEIITSVSPANKMGSDKVFIVGGRSFIYVMERKGPKIDPWGTSCFTVPHFEVNLFNDSIFFCFVLFSLRQDLHQLATVP